MATKIPDKCPECGCDIDSYDANAGKVVYECGSVYYSGPVDTSFYQSTACKVIISLTIDNDMWADHYAKLSKKYIECVNQALIERSFQHKEWFFHDGSINAVRAIGELVLHGVIERNPENANAFRWIERNDDDA